MHYLMVGGQIKILIRKARSEILSDFNVFIEDVICKGSESVRYLIITIQYIDAVRTL